VSLINQLRLDIKQANDVFCTAGILDAEKRRPRISVK